MFSEALIVLVWVFCTSVKTVFIAVYCRMNFRASSIWCCVVLLLAVAQRQRLHHDTTYFDFYHSA